MCVNISFHVVVSNNTTHDNYKDNSSKPQVTNKQYCKTKNGIRNIA